MLIRLNNIYLCEQLSERCVAFHAELYVRNGKAGVAENKGYGGPTLYSSQTEEGRKLIQEAEEWCKSCPPLVSRDIVVEEKPFTIPLTLELFLDQLVAEYLHEMDSRRLRRRMMLDMSDGILFGVPGSGYSKFTFKAPIAAILAGEAGIKMLESLIHEKVLPHLRDGERILNTNLSADIIEKLNIPQGKLIDPPPKEMRKRAETNGEQGRYRGKKKKPAS